MLRARGSRVAATPIAISRGITQLRERRSHDFAGARGEGGASCLRMSVSMVLTFIFTVASDFESRSAKRKTVSRPSVLGQLPELEEV